VDFRLTPEQEKRRQEYHAVCRELSLKAPHPILGEKTIFGTDHGWKFFRYCAKEFAKRGWLSLSWPSEYGGTGDRMDQVLLAEAMGYNGVPGIDPFGVGMLAPTLLAVGSEELKKEFLVLSLIQNKYKASG